MAYGYNLELTPLQTLAFYNAIANNGELVKCEVRVRSCIPKHFQWQVKQELPERNTG